MGLTLDFSVGSAQGNAQVRSSAEHFLSLLVQS